MLGIHSLMRIDGDTESNWCIKIGLDDENFLVNCEGLINGFDDFDCLWTLLLFGIWIIYCWSIWIYKFVIHTRPEFLRYSKFVGLKVIINHKLANLIYYKEKISKLA